MSSLLCCEQQALSKGRNLEDKTQKVGQRQSSKSKGNQKRCSCSQPITMQLWQIP